MDSTLTFIMQSVWYLAPMGIANMAPVFMRNTLKPLGVPVDKYLGNKQIFGSHKTVRGILVAIPFGFVAFAIEQLLARHLDASIGFFDYRTMTLWFGILAGLGAILGDLFRSAIKRRSHIRPGGRFVPLDQLDYVIGGMLFTAFLFRPTLSIILVTLIIGGLLHALTSWIAYLLGLKHDRL